MVEVHEVFYHTKYQDSMHNGFRQEAGFMFSLYNVTHMGGSVFGPMGYNSNRLGKGPLNDDTYQMPRL